MGEVYRATDSNLKRSVAIKVLPASVAGDADRLARFQREAEVLAALNHPYIATIYGFEKTPDFTVLVMELVEGEDLAQRLTRGAIPIDEALPIAKQIAEALEAAHEQGIIHRDLKPANIKVRSDGTVKVLDFGLAKALDPAAGSSPTMSMSPTITTPAMTQAGMILGTAAYMSPEQAKGRAVDKRSDVWAFGCVFFEMLAGKRAFDGEDVTDTIAAVVRGEPDWSALPPDTTDQIRLLIKRCLEKDRKTRISDVSVARFLMTETMPSPQGAGAAVAAAPRGVRRRAILAASIGLAAVIAMLAIAVWVGTRLIPERAEQPARFRIVPPPSQALAIPVTSTDRDVAITPDGTHIVYRSGATDQTSFLTVRALNELDARPLPTTGGNREPFLSPDGHWIGFFTLGEIRKVSMTGGPPITICKVTGTPRGASWGSDDRIVFAVADPRTGLLSVPAGGGEPKVLTHADTAKGEATHAFPFVLPGDRAVLFTIFSSANNTLDNAQVAVLDLKTGQQKTLIRGATDAAYVASSTMGQAGYLIYAASGSLRAVRFDPARLEVVGDAVPVVEQVMTTPAGEANFAISRQGTLVYVPGGVAGSQTAMRSLVWVNRQGKEEAIKAPPHSYAVARVSPDGTRLALDLRDQTNDIWIWDFGHQTLTPVNLDPAVDMSPVWTPDGRRIIWVSTRAGGNPNLYWQAADGTGAPMRLTTHIGTQFATSISSDGTAVAIFGTPDPGSTPNAPTSARTTNTALDISVVTLSPGAGSPAVTKTLIQSGAAKTNPEISPDGHWIAYQSDESGQVQIYVRPYPNVDSGRWQVSPNGGTRPAWARSGRELFYLDASGLLTSVAVQAQSGTQGIPSFSASTPTKILETAYYLGASTRGFDLRAYDIAPDGQRFLMIKDAASTEQKAAAPTLGMVVVLNWIEELKARVPTK
jgi:serine/threonine-protein kinase